MKKTPEWFPFAIGLLAITLFTSIVVLMIHHVFKLECSNRGINAAWYDMVKTSVTILGTAFTMIVGFYFGNRSAAQTREFSEKTQETLVEVLKVMQKN
jgi:uncharacterized membrane protein